jgi:hypothetical protein
MKYGAHWYPRVRLPCDRLWRRPKKTNVRKRRRSSKDPKGVGIGLSWGCIQHSALFSFLYVPRKLSERHRLHPAGGYSHDGWQIKCEVDISRTCQSLRTLRSQSKKVEEAAPTILRPLTVGPALKCMFNWDFSLLSVILFADNLSSTERLLHRPK